MQNINRVSSADALALLSATDDQGRIDPLAFEAQRQIFANEKIGGIDAKGLLIGMTGSSLYTPNNNDAFIDAIMQRLDKDQARHFGEALDAQGLRDNALQEMGRDIGQKFGRGWDEITQFRDRVDKGISDSMSHKVQSLDHDIRDPDNNMAEKVLAGSAKHVVQYGQFRYGDITGTGKHAFEMLGETVDMVKMAHRFASDENYRNILTGMAQVYAADTLEDRFKPSRDAANMAVGLWKEWEHGLDTAKKQGKETQYLGESGGALGLEVVLAIVPLSELGKFGKMAKALEEITPHNPGVLNEIIGEASRHLDHKSEVPHKTPTADAPSKPDTSPRVDAPTNPEKMAGEPNEMREAGAQTCLKGATRMARHDNVLEELIVKAKPSEVDHMLRQGSFTPQELGQMLRSEKPALGEQLFENVKFNEALNATTKGVDLAQLSQRHTGDIAEAMMTQKWVKEGYSDIHAIKNNSEHGSDLVGRRPSDKELEFMEVKGSAHGKAKAQTGDPQSKVMASLDKAAEGQGHWDPKNTQLGVKALAGEFRKEIVANGGEINATWAKVNLKRDLNTGELGYDGSVEKWMSPDERKVIKTQSKGGNASKPDGDDVIDHATPKKTAELSPKDSLGLDTMLAAVRKDGRWDEEQSKNIAAAAMLGHVNDPLQKQIDSVRINERGGVFSTYSPHGDKDPHFHSHVNGHEAAQIPAEQSVNQVAQVRQQQQQDAQAITQQQTQDPNTPKGPKLT
jgi:hypothetical protein